MGKRPRFEIAPTSKGPGWDLKRDGVQLQHSATKAPLVDKAPQIAKQTPNSQLIIKRADGTIQDERTYGKDPFPPKG